MAFGLSVYIVLCLTWNDYLLSNGLLTAFLTVLWNGYLLSNGPLTAESGLTQFDLPLIGQLWKGPSLWFQGWWSRLLLCYSTGGRTAITTRCW